MQISWVRINSHSQAHQPIVFSHLPVKDVEHVRNVSREAEKIAVAVAGVFTDWTWTVLREGSDVTITAERTHDRR